MRSDNNRRMIHDSKRQLLKAISAGVGISALAGCGQEDGADGEGDGGDGDGSSSADGDDDGSSSSMQRVETIDFAHWTGSQRPQYAEESQQAIAAWEELGLEFERNPVGFPNPLLDLYAQGDFDMAHLAYGATAVRLDPEDYMRNVFHSDAIGDGNYSRWANSEFDSLVEEQAQTLDPEARREPVYEAQVLEAEEQPVITHLFPQLVVGINTARADPPSTDQTIPGEGFQSKWTLTHALEPKRDDGAHAVALVEGEFSTINPLLVRQTQGRVYTRAMHDTLVITGPDSQPRNWLAEEINIVDDTTIEVTIRDNQTFHDGEPVTPEDVVFSYEFIADNNVPAVAAFLQTFESASTDGEVITLNLSEPYAPFVPLTMQLVQVLPRHIWEGVEDPQAFFNENRDQAVIGNGPFEFSRLEEGSLLEYTTNPDHFSSPKMDILRYKLYGQQSSAVQAIIRGEATTMKLIQPSLVPNVEQSDDAEIHYQEQHKNHQFFINVERDMPFADKAFRNALALSIPREQMAQQIYNGRASYGGSFIAPANEFWHNPDVEPASTTAEIEEARALLEEAGYDWDDDGRLMYPTS